MEPPAKRARDGDRLPPPSPGAGGRGAGGVGGRGGGSPGAGGVGGRGGGSPARAAGGAGRLVSGRASPPENLIAVGRVVGNIEHVLASGGISLNVDVETRLTDLYKISPWWLELPDVEDVMNQQRRKILVEVIPLGDPSTATLASMHLQQEGRAIYHRYTIALYRGGQDFFGVVVGTPPVWFTDAVQQRSDGFRGSFQGARVLVPLERMLVEPSWLR